MLTTKEKKYSNEHPKKLSKTKSIKLAKYKGNGKIGDRFMKHYNYYLNELGHSPSAAFEAAEGAIYLLDYYKK